MEKYNFISVNGKAKSFIAVAAVAVVSAFSLSSCYCDKVTVGDINPGEELVHVKSVRNAHVIGGAIVSHDKASNYVGETKDYVVETKMTFTDHLLAGVTCGIYTPTTTKYYVSKNNPNVVVEKKKKGSKAYKGYMK